MKGIYLLELCYSLGIVNSYSRPRVSNDNAHIEAVFKTVKYCPAYPYGGFADLEEARRWVYGFVEGYNHFHRHSGIKYVTPDESMPDWILQSWQIAGGYTSRRRTRTQRDGSVE